MRFFQSICLFPEAHEDIATILSLWHWNCEEILTDSDVIYLIDQLSQTYSFLKRIVQLQEKKFVETSTSYLLIIDYFSSVYYVNI